MAQKSCLSHLVFAAVLMACLNGNLLAAWGKAKAPAGQRCPMGSYVIGFDSEANIICTGACGNGVVNPGETCDDGNTESGDACPASCDSGEAKALSADKARVTETEAAETAVKVAIPAASGATSPTPAPVLSEPVITRIKPGKLVYGKREISITITGSGFNSASVIKFLGTTYSPSVNQAGTELRVTLPTRELIIGAYPITVSNGPGMEVTREKGLEVY